MCLIKGCQLRGLHVYLFVEFLKFSIDIAPSWSHSIHFSFFLGFILFYTNEVFT